MGTEAGNGSLEMSWSEKGIGYGFREWVRFPQQFKVACLLRLDLCNTLCPFSRDLRFSFLFFSRRLASSVGDSGASDLRVGGGRWLCTTTCVPP